MNNYNIFPLPPNLDLETKSVLKKVAEAHRYLAELKGVASTIPNEEILINTLTLQEVRDENIWERWIIFILDGVINTSKETILLVENIKKLMDTYKLRIKDEAPKIYSQDLINNIFRHPYTKIEFLVDELNTTRQTASKYLDQLVEIGLMDKQKIGKSNYYINTKLFSLLIEGEK